MSMLLPMPTAPRHRSYPAMSEPEEQGDDRRSPPTEVVMSCCMPAATSAKKAGRPVKPSHMVFELEGEANTTNFLKNF